MKNKEKLYYSLGIGIIIVAIIFLCVVFFNKKYTITMYNDGEEYKVIKIEKGEKLKLPDAPEKEGYTFSGWYVDGKEFDSDTKITKDLELEAKWVKNTYTVVFKTGTGSDITKKVKYKDKVAKPSNPTKEGYEFVGWFIGNKKYNFASKVTKDLEITAKWTKVSTTSKTNSTSNVKRTERNAEQSVAYQVEHYLMDTKGKYSDKPNYIDSYTTVVGAKVNPIVHSYKGFTSPIVQTVTAGNNTVVKYYYERNKYQLTLNNSEGITAVKGNGTYYYDQEVVIEATLHEGYSFADWLNGSMNVADTLKTTVKMSDSNLSLTATAKINDTTIIYYDEKGNEIATDIDAEPGKTVKENTNAKAYEIKEGYTFAGWYTADGTKFDFDNNTMPIKGGLKLTAKFEANEYTVHFDSNGGTESMNDQTFKYDDGQALNSNEFTREGYTFQGWSKEAAGTTVDYKDGAVANFATSDEITLYAVWKANTYTVKFDANNGTGQISNQKFTYDEQQELTANEFTREGYTFQGWSKTQSGEVEFGDKYKVGNLVTENNGTLTLYAVWKANEYTVKFEANFEGYNEDTNGTMEDQKFTYDDGQKLTDNKFTREGYTFQGWSTTKKGPKEYNDGEAKNFTTKNTTVTLYAVWKANEVTIHYHGNNKNHDENTQTFTVESTESKDNGFTNSFRVTYQDKDGKNPTKTEDIVAEFECWSETEDGECIDTTEFKNEVIEALNKKDGEEFDLYAEWTADIEIKNPEEDSQREFVGWYLNDKPIDEMLDSSEHGKYTIDTDIVIVAKYLKILDLDNIIKDFVKDDTDIYTLNLDSNIITIDIKKPNIKISDLQAIKDLNEFLVQNADIITSNKVAESNSSKDLEEYLKEIGKHQLSYLYGKNLSLTIKLDEKLAKFEKNSEIKEKTYTIKFTNNSKNIITVKEYNEFAEKMLPLINTHQSTRYNVSVNDSNIKVLYADSTSTLTLASSLQGSGILTVFQQYLAKDYIKSMELTLPKKEGFDGTDMHVTVYPDNVTDDNYIIFGLSLVEYFENAGYEKTIKNQELDNIIIKVKINPQDGKYFQEGIFDEFNITFGPQNQA